jgi:hypothetical protein
LSVALDTVARERELPQDPEEVTRMTAQRPGPSQEGDGAALGSPRWLDWQVLLEALADSGRLADADADQDAVLADELAAAEDGRMSPPDLAWTAAIAAEHMTPGAAQAAWLEVATAAAGRLDEDALAGMMIASRQAVSRATATELTAAAQITARAAAADPRIGLEADGRPVRLCRDAQGQIGLALMLTDCSAATWADLGMTLAWRLPSTGAALASGVIDLDRAKAIAEATSVLSEELARQVEAKVLPGARRRTVPDLKDRLRHLVIAADPAGAEERRKAAERHANVRLYGEVDQTATIVADKQPQIEAAAGFARLNALARARKAAGFKGPLGWHRSQVLLGLLNGTLPPTPPAQGAPPDDPGPGGPAPSDGPGPGGPVPSDGPGPGGPSPSDGGPHDGYGPRDGGRGDGGPGGDHRRSDPRRANDSHGGTPDADDLPDDLPAPRDEDAPEDDGLDELLDRAGQDDQWDPDEDDDDLAGTGPGPVWPDLGAIPPALARPARPVDGRPVPGLLDVTLPWLTLADQSQAPGLLGRIGPITADQARHLAAAAEQDPAVPWRVIVTNATGQAIAVSRIRRRTRGDPSPESSCRDGPCHDGPPGTGLVGRITLVISQDTITAARQAAGPGLPSGAGPPSTTRSATGTDPRGHTSPPAGVGPPATPSSATRSAPLGKITTGALRAATQALDLALAQARADQAAGGCAHTGESPAYRPPPRLREYVIARDVTCRKPTCRQPAWRGDLDHTHPYDQDGRTCGCNLGGACRGDHQLKQHPRWKLEQTQPGIFTWTTPAGRTYTTGPDTYAA